MKKAVFVVGPTASGKSGFALKAAGDFKSCIINCDSIQFYRELIIGSAAPSNADKKKCPHHLYQNIDYPLEMTAGEYIRQFDGLRTNLAEKIYFVVGGTGFYFQALEYGMYDVAASSEERRAEFERLLETPEGHQLAYAEMLAADPELKDKIHFADKYRIVRALEILKFTDKKPSEMAKQKREKRLVDEIVKIGFSWDINVLKRHIQKRTKFMLNNGLIEEVQNLLHKGYSAGWAPLNSVGYKETVQFLNKEIRRDELEDLISLRTGQLAKKQMTWFKRDAEVKWFPIPIDSESIILKNDKEFDQDLSQGLAKVYQQAMDYLQIKLKD